MVPIQVVPVSGNQIARNNKMRMLTYISVLFLAVLTVGCGGVSLPKEDIFSCEGFEIYPDSIVRGNRIYRAVSPREISNAWTLPDSTTVAPEFISTLPMADALFAKAVISPSFLTPEEIWLSLGFLRPEESMQALRSLAWLPENDNEDFPYSTLSPYWAAAAWEVYCATGSRTWLREAYDALTRMLSRQWKLNRSALSEFYCGIPRGVTEQSTFYPASMDEMSRFQTFSASVNIMRAYSLRIASRMAGELKLYAEREWEMEADKLAGAVNDCLWLPDLQRYGQYLYGDYYPIVSSVTDNEANLLAALTGTATPEMSAAMVGELPLIASGVPSVYPYVVNQTPLRPVVQALYGLSAAKVRNPRAFIHSMASVWNLSLDANYPSLWPSLVMKGLFGIETTPSGLEFRPMVPEVFGGEKQLRGLRYRDAVLDISLNGTGDRIASFMVDSVSTDSHSLPAGMKGHHKVVITLSGNDLNAKPLRIFEPVTVPPTPEVKWPTANDMKIVGHDRLLHYDIYLDGVMTQSISTDNYHVRPGECGVVTVVPTLERGSSGYATPPHVCLPDDEVISIHASSITPRRPPLHFIKDPATATNYIELAARHNTRITCYVNVAVEGDYFITVGYSNGSERCGIRTLGVNGVDVATLLFPPRRLNDWVHVYPSTTSVIHLNEGVNKLWLTYVGGTILFNKLTLLKRS